MRWLGHRGRNGRSGGQPELEVEEEADMWVPYVSGRREQQGQIGHFACSVEVPRLAGMPTWRATSAKVGKRRRFTVCDSNCVEAHTKPANEGVPSVRMAKS